MVPPLLFGGYAMHVFQKISSFDESFQTQGMNLREYKTAQTPIMMLRSNFVMEK